MKKIHLDQCSSTQDYLIEKLKENKQLLLVSTDKQTSGHGRHENKWIQMQNTLCFSFVCKPNEVLTLTSAEMSLLICKFFETKYSQKLFLKWPNDLINSQKAKCGGLIINNTGRVSVVGIGVNLFSSGNDPEIDSDYPVGHIFATPIEYSYEQLANELFEFISFNRMSANEVRRSWEQYCFHSNVNVVITDGDFSSEGIFIGIGRSGEALLQERNQVSKIYNGHLRVKN